MGILINAIDIVIAGTRDVVRRTMTDMMFRYEGEQTVRINSPNIFGVKQAINNARSISQRLRKPIQKMRLYGHSAPGIQGMGRGNWSQTTDRTAARSYDAEHRATHYIFTFEDLREQRIFQQIYTMQKQPTSALIRRMK
jgi:hypothetical protein